MAKNAIVRRIELLSDQWQEFAAAPEARLLCWQVAEGEARMVDAFFECEADERTAEHPDLFMPLTTPFAEPAGHAVALRNALVQEYAQDSDGLRELGIDTGWEPPPLRRQEAGLLPLIRVCESLHAHYEMPGKLVLVLQPDRVSDGKAYQLWLHQLAHEAPASLRVVLIDELEHPAYVKLIEARSPRVVAARAELDMPGALQELSNEAGNLDTPGGQFRDLFVRLTNLLGKRDLAGATQLGDRALALIAEHSLWHLAVPIHFALASGLLAANRSEDAVLQFAASEAAALRGEQQGPADARPTCRTLRMHSRLGHGSALLCAKEYERAAHHFTESAAFARELGDPRCALDCHRLACFGWERAGHVEQALAAGRAGLDVARGMDRATLDTSTFDYLTEGMMRVTAGLQRRSLRREVERDLAAFRAARASTPPPPPPPPTAPPPPPSAGARAGDSSELA
jgi:hypothetical protein